MLPCKKRETDDRAYTYLKYTCTSVPKVIVEIILMPQIVILIKQKIIAFFWKRVHICRTLNCIHTYVGLYWYVLICRQVCAADINENSLQRTVTEWKKQYGDGFVIASRCDVTKGKELEGDHLRKGLLAFHINWFKFFYFENWNHHHVDINIFFCNFQRLSNKPNLRFPT